MAPLTHAVAEPLHSECCKALASVYESGGLLDQAKDAQTNGTLADFFKQLVAQLGPMIGPIILTLIASLLHIPIPAKP